MNQRLSYPNDFSISIARLYQGLTGKHDDGTEWIVFNDVLFIDLADGRSYYLPNGRVDRVFPEDGDASYDTVVGSYDPETLIHKVVEHGVDLNNWVFVPVTASLEEILESELEREREHI